MFVLLQIGIVIALTVLIFEVFRLHNLCNQLQRNNSAVTATIRTQKIILTDGAGSERYSISLAENPEKESFEKLHRSLYAGKAPPELPPQLEIRAGNAAVLAIDNGNSINFYDGRTVLYPDGVVLGNSEGAPLKAQVDILLEGEAAAAGVEGATRAPSEYWLGRGAEIGSVGVLFNDGEPQVWALRKGERRPRRIAAEP